MRHMVKTGRSRREEAEKRRSLQDIREDYGHLCPIMIEKVMKNMAMSHLHPKQKG